MTKCEGLGLFFILLIGSNAEWIRPWWLPQLLVLLICLLMIASAYRTAFKRGAHF